jgi:hypothetical protein
MCRARWVWPCWGSVVLGLSHTRQVPEHEHLGREHVAVGSSPGCAQGHEQAHTRAGEGQDSTLPEDAPLRRVHLDLGQQDALSRGRRGPGPACCPGPSPHCVQSSAARAPRKRLPRGHVCVRACRTITPERRALLRGRPGADSALGWCPGAAASRCSSAAGWQSRTRGPHPPS